MCRWCRSAGAEVQKCRSVDAGAEVQSELQRRGRGAEGHRDAEMEVLRC